tara:strand:+ start:398 stop:1426 length:1029 start_codon:yes stop_codon:yes gene_type:complete
MSSPQNFSFLVVGAGSIGKRHLSNIRYLFPSANIDVLCRKESTGQYLYDLGANNLFNSINQAISHGHSAAVLANPSTYHIEYSQILANNGYHLFVEKPLSNRLDGVNELIRTCENNNLTLMVGYCLRFYPSLKHMVRLIKDGFIGNTLHISSEIGQYLPDWRAGTDYRNGVTAQNKLGGGAVLELSHEIDIALWIGDKIKSVIANLAKISDLDIDVEDCADISLKFESGAIGNIHLDLLQRYPVRKTKVIGTKGTLIWDGIADELLHSMPGVDFQKISVSKITDRNDLYLKSILHFYQCIQNRQEPIVNGISAHKVLEVALAAKVSDHEKRVVYLDNIANLK